MIFDRRPISGIVCLNPGCTGTDFIILAGVKRGWMDRGDPKTAKSGDLMRCVLCGDHSALLPRGHVRVTWIDRPAPPIHLDQRETQRRDEAPDLAWTAPQRKAYFEDTG